MNGFLLIDKPIGMTSFDVVRRVKRIFKTKKVGHAGTLDPDASGLLLIAVNHATRLLRFLKLDPKIYRFEIVLGTQTNTDDAVGEIIAQAPVSVTMENINALLPLFSGKIKQRPPLFSAIHIEGKRAYKKAREGKDFIIPKRDVEVFNLELLSFDSDVITMEASVSSGTYIRSIARDFGEALGTKAHARAIRRISLANYHVNMSVLLENITLESLIQPENILNDSIAMVEVSEKDLRRLQQGMQIDIDLKEEIGTFLGILHSKKLVGVGELIEKRTQMARLQPRVIFSDE